MEKQHSTRDRSAARPRDAHHSALRGFEEVQSEEVFHNSYLIGKMRRAFGAGFENSKSVSASSSRPKRRQRVALRLGTFKLTRLCGCLETSD